MVQTHVTPPSRVYGDSRYAYMYMHMISCCYCCYDRFHIGGDGRVDIRFEQRREEPEHGRRHQS